MMQIVRAVMLKTLAFMVDYVLSLNAERVVPVKNMGGQ
jgi:hypothetical protein